MKINFIWEKTPVYLNFTGFIDRYLSYIFIFCTNHSFTNGDVCIVTLFVVGYPQFKLDELDQLV